MPATLFVLGLIALAGSTLTQLRFSGVPAGVPEIAGVLFIVAVFAAGKPLLPLFWQVLGCVGLILVGFLIGSINNLMLGDISPMINSDLLAVGYAALVAAGVANEIAWTPPRILLAARALALVILLHALPLLADLFGAEFFTSGWHDEPEFGGPDAAERLSEISGVESLTDKSSRYSGFTTNPNQLMVVTSLAAVLFPWVALRVRGAFAPLWFLMTLVSLGLLVLTKGSTGMVSVMLAGALIAMRRFATTEDERGVARYHLAAVVGTWVLLLPVLFFLNGFIDRAIGSEDGPRTASGRFDIWRASVEGIFQTRFLGAGPGGHAGYDGPFQREEAHNVALDLLLQGGVISVAAIALALWLIFSRSVRGHTAIGIGLFSMFIAWGSAHYLLRHPLVWFALCLPVAINYHFSEPARRWRAEQRALRERRRERGARSPGGPAAA